MNMVQLGREFQRIPRVDDMSADGTSRWPEDNVNQDGWREQNNQAHGKKLFSSFVRNKLPAEKNGRTDTAIDDQSPRRNHA